MSKNNQSLLQELKDLAKGLMFMSESDYPVEPFVESASDKKALTAQDIVAAKKTDANAPVSEVNFDDFFRNAAQPQEWQSPEAQQTAKRFQALVKTLKDNLSDIKVYKVGTVEADVYVIGKTASGDFAGVKTKVIET